MQQMKLALNSLAVLPCWLQSNATGSNFWPASKTYPIPIPIQTPESVGPARTNRYIVTKHPGSAACGSACVSLRDFSAWKGYRTPSKLPTIQLLGGRYLTIILLLVSFSLENDNSSNIITVQLNKSDSRLTMLDKNKLEVLSLRVRATSRLT